MLSAGCRESSRTSISRLPTASGGSYPTILGVVNGALHFTASDGVHGNQLWKSDGTTTGTTMVTDFPQAECPIPGGVLPAWSVLAAAVFFEDSAST